MRTVRNALAVLLSMMIVIGTTLMVPVSFAEPDESNPATYQIIAWNDCAVVTNTSNQTISCAIAGQDITITFNSSILQQYEIFVSWGNCDGFDVSPYLKKQSFTIKMPANDIIIQAETGIDEKAKAEDESKEASIKASERESESIEKSIAESESISESESKAEAARIASSIAASEYAAKTIKVGSYDVYVHLTKATAPDDFVIANDQVNFSENIECFYSSKFRTYAYYAKKNEESNYCIYDKMTQDMMPFVTFNGAGDVKYLVISPDSELDLPEEVLAGKNLNLSTLTSSSSMFVPAWTVLDDENNEHTVIYLVNDEGEKDFFVYDNSTGSIRLTEWNRFKEELTEEETESTEEDTEESSTKVTETEKTTEETYTTETSSDTQNKRKGLKNFALWLVIIGAVIVLLIVAIIVVFYMSKKQEEEEALLDEEDYEDEEEMNPDDEEYESSYTNNSAEDEELSAFDFNFEDAFPAEIAPAAAKASEKEIAMKTSNVEVTDPSFGEELDEYLSDQGFEVEDFSKKN